ncbi:MAG: copper amine oxidase N-terminal domain-containing protein [Clostridia bacterium]|nr:copper amine oxidase N-terminal domain-containing protein [Clostridia bacterium]
MKKAVLLLLAVSLLIIPLGAMAKIDLPGYENTITIKPIANLTVRFLHYDGSGGYGTFDIYPATGYTTDDAIRATLIDIHTTNQTEIYAITHINGIAIENTPYAEFGGRIKHKGSPDNPVVSITIPLHDEVYVAIEKEIVDFPDQQAVIINNRTMVPLRGVFEHHNVQAEVEWDGETRTVTAKDRELRTLTFKIGDKNYQIKHFDGRVENKTTDVAPTIRNGRTLLPLRALAESLNFNVDWINEQRKVDITEKPGYQRKLMDKEKWEEYLYQKKYGGENK